MEIAKKTNETNMIIDDSGNNHCREFVWSIYKRNNV